VNFLIYRIDTNASLSVLKNRQAIRRLLVNSSSSPEISINTYIDY
jgi:hypothetical protein